MAAEKMEAATGRRRNGRTVDFEMGKAERGGRGEVVKEAMRRVQSDGGRSVKGSVARHEVQRRAARDK